MRKQISCRCNDFHIISFSGNLAYATAPYHIGIVTGTVPRVKTNFVVQRVIEEYGEASSGGMIVHVTYPDNFMQEMETVISQIVGLADDPLLKAIVVNQSIPGTTEAFRRVKKEGQIFYALLQKPRRILALLVLSQISHQR